MKTAYRPCSNGHRRTARSASDMMILGLLLLVCGLVAFQTVAYASGPLYGVDVSKWEGTINWDTLNAATNFAIIRSSYGAPSAGETVAQYTDSQLARNQSEARRVGILRGYYHYSYPQYNTPQAEAAQFINAVGTIQPGEILCLDFEENYSDPVTWCKTFLDSVRSASGISPLLYINYGNEISHDWSSVVNAGYPLWLADWDGLVDPSSPATQWTPNWTIKQYADNGIVGGMNPIDLDVFNGTSSQFQALGGSSGSSGSSGAWRDDFSATSIDTAAPEPAWTVIASNGGTASESGGYLVTTSSAAGSNAQLGDSSYPIYGNFIINSKLNFYNAASSVSGGQSNLELRFRANPSAVGYSLSFMSGSSPNVITLRRSDTWATIASRSVNYSMPSGTVLYAQITCNGTNILIQVGTTFGGSDVVNWNLTDSTFAADGCFFLENYQMTDGRFDYFSYTPLTNGIEGTVKDSGGNPVSGATVSTSTGGYSATTASDGTYTILGMTTGTYSVTASKTGTASQTLNSVSVSANTISAVNFVMPVSGVHYINLQLPFDVGTWWGPRTYYQHNCWGPNDDQRNADDWFYCLSTSSSCPYWTSASQASLGLNLRAACSGTVVRLKYNEAGYGNSIVIQSDENPQYYTLYAHLNSFVTGIGMGKHYDVGELIGQVGESGSGSGGFAHLHFELEKELPSGTDWAPVDVSNLDMDGQAVNYYGFTCGSPSWLSGWISSALQARDSFQTSGTISGRVVDASGNAISGVTVSTSSEGYSTSTDANGNYSIPYVLVGTYYLTASKTGYDPAVNTGVVVSAGGTTTSNFSLSVTNTANDAGTGADAGNTNAAATAVSAGSYTGYLNLSTDANDYYKFPVTSGQYVTCTMTPQSGADFDLYLYDPSGALMRSSTTRGSGMETVGYTAASTGNWVVRVNAYSGSGEYSLNIGACTGDTPTGTNLALTSTPTTDSYLNSSKAGAKAIDGVDSASSEWISLTTVDPNWLALDLGAVHTVNGFVVKLPGSETESYTYNATKFTVQSGISPIGPWTDECIVYNTAQANIITRSFLAPKLLRYIRLNVILSGADATTRIPEFEVWGNPDSTPPTTPVVTDDGVYTTDTTHLHATWTSADPRSGIAEYQYCVGTTPGGWDVVGWTSAGTTAGVDKVGLSLVYGRAYYFAVKARNNIGLWSAIGVSDGITAARPVATISIAKSYPDTSVLQLAIKPVSASNASALWIEESNRSSGIKVNFASSIQPGAIVTTTGRMATSQGERYLDQAVVQQVGTTTPPQAIAINNGSIGGTALNAYTLGVFDGVGPNNIGLLVTTWGRVTSIGSGYLYIDDGSGLNDGTGNATGLRVICTTSGHSIGDFLFVTGLSSCFTTTSGDIARQVIMTTAY